MVLCQAYAVKNIVYLKKIPSDFHNGSNYDYHFIVKELKNLKNNLLF